MLWFIRRTAKEGDETLEQKEYDKLAEKAKAKGLDVSELLEKSAKYFEVAKNKMLEKVYGLKTYTKQEVTELCKKYAEIFKPYVCFDWQEILEDAKLQSENILVNTEKMIESEGKKIISSLSQKTALASVELAKKHIVETLKNKPQYHANFINSSIDELDRLKF